MAINIGSLLVSISADTTKFVEGITRANSKLDTLERATKSVGVALGGLLTIATVKKLGDLAMGAISAADQLGGLANKIGINVESLQEWQYIASQSNVSVEALNQSLTKFTSNVGEAAQFNKGPLVESFKALGLSVRDSSGNVKSAEELLGEYVAALSQVEDTTVRNALAVKAFGKSGVEMVNIASAGADNINKLTNEARDLGIVLSESTIKNADKTNDELDKMQRIVGVQLQKALLDLSPVVIATATTFATLAMWAGNFFDTFRDVESRTALGPLREEMSGLLDQRLRLKKLIAEHTNPRDTNLMGLRVTELKAIEERINKINERMLELQKNREWSPPKIPDVNGGLLDPADDDKQKELQKLQDDLMTEEEMLASSFGRRAEMIQKALDAKLISEQKANSLIREEQIKLMDGLAELQNQGSIKKELDQYLDNLKSKEEMTAEAYARRAEILQKAREQELIDEEKFNGLMLYEQEKLVNDIATIRQSGAEKIREIEQNTISMSIGLLEMLGREHKDFARAYILISKGLSIALAIQNTAVAVTKALTIDPTGVLAARVKMMGAIQVGIIAATGALELASLNQGSGGGGSASSPTSPTFQANPVTGAPSSSQRGGTTTIYLEGRPGDSFTYEQVDSLMDAIYEASERGDRFVIAPNSRNAIDIRNAS